MTADDGARRIVLWWQVVGVGTAIVGGIVGAAWAARSYVDGKASAAELHAVSDKVGDHDRRISIVEAIHVEESEIHKEESDRLSRIENKLDRFLEIYITNSKGTGRK